MSELILYSFRRCPFAIRVRVVLEEKGLPYTVIEEDLKAVSADLLRLNPAGKVPVLIDGETVLPESSVITQYLEAVHPEVALMPRSPQQWAQMRLWTLWCDQTFKPDLDRFKYKFDDIPEGERDAFLRGVQSHLQKLDTALARSQFLLGNEFTLADVHLFPFYRQLQKSRPDFSKLLHSHHLDGWLERITSRPSFLNAMALRPTQS